MRTEALFINGVFRGVLEEVLYIQTYSPDHIMYLQPYGARAIAHLRDHPPSPSDPVLLVLSLMDDLGTIHYATEIVGWDDKTQLSVAKCDVLNRAIEVWQPGEKNLYNAAEGGDRRSVNLLHVRRMRQVRKPFSVMRLVRTKDGRPIAGPRPMVGGWTYVQCASAIDLAQ